MYSRTLGHESWVEPYDLAVLESDPARLAARIETAASAIALRVAQMAEMPDSSGKSDELESISKALQVLRYLAEHATTRKTMVI